MIGDDQGPHDGPGVEIRWLEARPIGSDLLTGTITWTARPAVITSVTSRRGYRDHPFMVNGLLSGAELTTYNRKNVVEM
jgi:hypothetical protein